MLPEDLSAALDDLGLTRDDIAHVMSLLTDDASNLDALEVWAPQQRRFGQSPLGQQMAVQAQLAREVAGAALLEMSASLRQYVNYLDTWQRAATEADLAAGDDLLRFRTAVGRLTAPTLADES